MLLKQRHTPGAGRRTPLLLKGPRLGGGGISGVGFDPGPDVWARATSGLGANPLAKARVLVAGFDPAQHSALEAQLREIGVTCVVALPCIEALSPMAASDRAFSHAIVDFDAYEDVSDGVDALLGLRSSAPGLVIVLCSAMVRGDDLGTDRQAICDATLRLPVSLPRLRDGLRAASGNHFGRSDCDARSPAR